jgi:hypothetical protein
MILFCCVGAHFKVVGVDACGKANKKKRELTTFVFVCERWMPATQNKKIKWLNRTKHPRTATFRIKQQPKKEKARISQVG